MIRRHPAAETDRRGGENRCVIDDDRNDEVCPGPILIPDILTAAAFVNFRSSYVMY
jgi:hypothetical protein